MLYHRVVLELAIYCYGINQWFSNLSMKYPQHCTFCISPYFWNTHFRSFSSLMSWWVKSGVNRWGRHTKCAGLGLVHATLVHSPFGASLKKNMSKTTTNSSAAVNLYQARMGPNSNTKTPETHNLNAQTSSNCFEKMLHHGKHAPVPTILRPRSRHHILNEHILCIKL